MKKIGILFGMESTFPPAFIERVNAMAKAQNLPVVAEAVTVDIVEQGNPTEYAVIVDRISQDVPFYRAYVKNAAISGTAVLNNPFWFSADEKFFNNALAVKLGVPVPRTVLLPSKQRPDDTSEMSFRNLKFPLSWPEIFEHIGFPAFMKPHSGGGWKSVYKVDNADELFTAYAETDQLVMMLQEAIDFDDYFRCYCLNGKYVRIMQYEPRNPHHLRYVSNNPPASKEMLATVEKYVLALNNALGYDFNTVEFAVRNGVPIAIDFCNPAPDADLNSVGEENFEWVVEHAAKMAIERALEHKEGQNNLTWGTYVTGAACAGTLPQSIQTKSVVVAAASTTKAAVKTEKAAPKVTAKAEKAAKPSGKKAEKEVAKPKAAKANAKDDLTKIEGIGPKIAQLLIDGGIATFANLAKAKLEKIQTILDAAGPRYRIHDPKTWPAQADMAAKGEWEKLTTWQDTLKGGK
jgi:predicted flap endonuclease-1-like 5' DNA nuclease